MNTRDNGELDRLGDMMRARIWVLVRDIWQLGGHKDGNDWVCPNPLRGDRHAGSFRIALSGKFQGMVTDFAGEAVPGSGKTSCSALSFHIALKHHGDKRDGIDWAKDFCGISGRDPKALAETKRALDQFDERPQENAEEVEKKRKRAQGIYLKGTVPWAGTPADFYYRGRGLNLGRLPFIAGAPRFKECCFCGRLGLPSTDPKAFLPAIVLPFVDAQGKFLAVHRTYLAEVNGAWVKHPDLGKVKLSYGAYAGGFIPLWAGTRALKRTGEIVYGQSLGQAEGPVRVHITEGPEDGWSVALAFPDERVVAAGSVSNMGGIAFGDKVTEVVIWKQDDPKGSAADNQFRRAVKNFRAQGKVVKVADVATTFAGVKDANDVIRGGDVIRGEA